MTIESEQCCDDLNPVDSCWLAAGQLSQRPQLMVLGNYVTHRLRREVGWLHDVGEFDAVLAAASRSVEGSRCGHVLTG